jgi:hypothetical protein
MFEAKKEQEALNLLAKLPTDEKAGQGRTLRTQDHVPHHGKKR